MDSASSWLLLLSLIGSFYVVFSQLYIDSLKQEIERNKPPF